MQSQAMRNTLTSVCMPEAIKCRSIALPQRSLRIISTYFHYIVYVGQATKNNKHNVRNNNLRMFKIICLNRLRWNLEH